MLKKTFISSMIFLSTSSTVFAKTTSYVGTGLGIGGYTQGSGLRGLTATVFGGAGKLVGPEEKFYLGGEASASVKHNSINQTGYGVGGSFIPGVMLTQSTMLYGRLGLAVDYYSHPNKQITFSTVTGIGLQTNVAKNLDVRVEYTAYGYKQPGNQAGVSLVYKFD